MPDNDEHDTLYNILFFLMVFSLLSVIVVFTAVFIYVSYHDYFYMTLYNMTTNLANTTTYVNAGTVVEVESIIENSEQILLSVDKFWFASFVVLIADIFFVSYKTKRIGIIPVLTLLTYGVLVFLFLSSIIFGIATQLKVKLIDEFFTNLNLPMPFFTWYLDNYGLINLLIVAVVILLNFVNFDNFKYFNQKNNEIKDDEL